MPSLHYLTVQDMLWINHRVTGKVSPFRYDTLEEATYYQYGYGPSLDLASQAQTLLSGLPAKHPFPEGNEATALVGALAFLRANGKDAAFDAAAARSWLAKKGEVPALKIREGHAVHGQPNFRAIIEECIRECSALLPAEANPVA